MVRDPVEAQDDLEREVERMALAVELSVLAIIARRLGEARGDSIAATYAAMPGDLELIRQTVSKGGAAISGKVTTAFLAMAEGNDAWAKPYYEASGRRQRKVAEDLAMNASLRASLARTRRFVDGMMRTSALAIVSKGRITLIEDAYKAIVGDAATSMVAGEASYSTAVSKAVSGLSEHGLRVMYASGHSRELYAAVRGNVMDAYRSTMAEIRRMQGEAFGADGWEVSAHIPSAPDHEPYQGRRFAEREWQLLEASLSRPLVTGANCRHIAYPVIMGIGKPAHTKAELDRMAKASHGRVTFDGVSGKRMSMTRYEASQYARGVEQSMRKLNARAYLAGQAGADASGATRKYDERVRDYLRICREVGITPQLDRTKVFVI